MAKLVGSLDICPAELREIKLAVIRPDKIRLAPDGQPVLLGEKILETETHHAVAGFNMLARSEGGVILAVDSQVGSSSALHVP